MLVDEARSTLLVPPRHRRRGADDDVDAARIGHAEHAEVEAATEVSKTGVALPSGASCRDASRDPHLVAGRCAIDGLQDELEIEAHLELADDDDRRVALFHRDEVAATDLALDDEAEGFEEGFDGRIERRFQNTGSIGATTAGAYLKTRPWRQRSSAGAGGRQRPDGSAMTGRRRFAKTRAWPARLRPRPTPPPTMPR